MLVWYSSLWIISLSVSTVDWLYLSVRAGWKGRNLRATIIPDTIQVIPDCVATSTNKYRFSSGGFTFNQYGMNPPASQYGMNPPPPQYTVNPPPPQYDQTPPPPPYGTSLDPVVVLQSPRPPQLGKDPVMTTCGNCQANVKFYFFNNSNLEFWPCR